MGHWLHQNIVEPGKLPLLLALSAFLLTFAVTRVITRMIRAGKGPFRNVTPGGVHVHHVVPGVVLSVVGGFGAVASGRHGVAAGICAVVFGMGAGLVLDEFALILHLDDVYWTEEGRQSVEVVVLTASLVVLVLAGFSPLGVDELSGDEEQGRLSVVVTYCVNFGFVLISLFKGKARMAVIGTLVPFIALVGALRLARPVSPWAKRFYRRRHRARSRAVLRAYHHDVRWAGPRRRFQDMIGGAPDRTQLPGPGPAD
ncbi:hypothetical protein [Streptomyces sp. B1I3]|uniref:hypothetical protein n=1 Tax=Streptomyces sp. B1I3 TaxID=3042264 RepID=UPI00277D26DF|nr:hypothetical protein [Streptomyces sp. B1I3]MDQ0796772.1 hypothetical protein [Streptomyces sp. B1I3]